MIRSLIFVPAKEKMLAKICNMRANAFIIDLEDSIEITEKSSALQRVKLYLENNEISDNIYIRLNKDNFRNELHELKEFTKIGFMLPKFESPDDYADAEEFMKEHFVIALVETPLGVVNIKRIVSCEWVNAVAFGAEDYTCRVNMKNSCETLLYQKSRLVTYAKAYEKFIYDTPSFSINDDAVFMSEVDNAVSLGFDGKLLIHPKHIDYINSAFGSNDLEYFKKIIEQYELSHKPVIVIDGKIYEKMHIDRMKKILKENGDV